MKISSAELAKKIKEGKGFVPNRTPMQALFSLLVKNGYLIASNTEMTVMVKLEGMENISEEFLLPPKAYNVLANMTVGDTEITTDERHVLSVTSGNSKMKFASLDPKQYSFEIDTNEADKHSAQIGAEVLKNAITKCLFAVDESSSGRVVMEVIYLEGKDGVLNVCGISGAEMAWNRVPYDGQFKLMLPIPAAKKLVALDLKGDVAILDDGKSVKFKTEECIFQCRLKEGEYLDYQKIFNELANYTSIDRQDMLKIVSRITSLSQNENSPIKMNFEDEVVNISYESPSSSYDETMALSEPLGSDGPIRIGFQPKLLCDLLKAYPADELRLNLQMGNMPMIVTADNCGLKAMLLPVLI